MTRGAAKGPSAVSLAMPVRTVDVVLNGAYPGWRVTMRANPARRVHDAYLSGELEPTLQALRELVLAWDVCDESGKVLPLPSEGGLDEVPYELLRDLIRGYSASFEAATDVPKA